MSRIHPSATVLLLLLAAVSAAGQTLTLPRDIAAGLESSAGSAPDQLTPVHDKVVFRASGSGTGLEVWASDGTSAGTELLREACPGDCSDDPEIVGTLNGAVLWATFPQRSRLPELWSTDGTRAGTRLLTSGVSASRDALATGFVLFRGALYFNRCESVSPYRCEIWRTDGTPEGTAVAIAEVGAAELYAAGNRLFLLDYDGRYRLRISDGTAAGTSTIAQDLDLWQPALAAVAGGRLFFLSGEDGGELWVSDGTAAGTRAVTDFQPESPFRPFLRAIGNRVWFIANDVVHGDELWVSDGTPEGTRRATDFPFYHPFDETVPSHLAEVGGRLVFRATDGLSGPQLWATDGRPESTARIRDLTVAPGPLIPAGGRVLFAGGDGQGTDVWITDGTAKGTRMVRDICPGCDAEAALLQASGAGALFVARSPSRGFEIWQTDGTEAGTQALTDMPAGRPATLPAAQNAAALYFQGADGHGDELWRADGEGTRLVADIARQPPGSLPRDLTAVGDRLFFTACEGLERQLWWTGGAPGDTGSAPILQGDDTCNNWSYALHYFTPAGNLLYFSRRKQGAQLWRTDGTAAGTVQLTRAPGEMSGFFDDPDMTGFQGGLYFLWNNDDDRAELWKSDGTSEGTATVVSLGGSYGAERLTEVGQELYFWAYRPQGDAVKELWRSDGTAAGTRTIASNLSAPLLPPGGFVRSGSHVYFYAMRDLADGLWRTDGTAAGTVPLIEDLPFDTWNLAGFQGDVYFLAGTSGFLRLWKVEGDSGAVSVVRELRSEAQLEDASFHLVAFAGRLFFQANDGIHGLELWSSDGTPEGTRLFRDILPGLESSRPSGLTVAGGRLFFTAHDGVHGTELWQTDGSEAGTRMVQDLHPGPASVPPVWLTATPSHLYLIADDGLSGQEIWALPLTVQGCRPSPERLCLEDGRFQVEAAWRDFQGNAGRGQAVPLTADTGWFWFFGPDNVETVLKVLDGRGLNGHRWVFYGALSSVEYHLTVTDSLTGAARRYFNPPGQLASVGDTQAFGPLGASESPLLAAPSPLPLTSVRIDPDAAGTACAPSSDRLCLNGGRFAVEASWKDFQGKTGTGTPVELTGDTGWFWFFNPENVEVVLKVLDGTTLNGHHWVFYGALSNVEYTLRVTDTATGTVRTYKNPSGRFASVADTEAF